MLGIDRPVNGRVYTYWVTVSFTLLTSGYLVTQVEAVQGCSVFFQPDFKWKRALCDSANPRLASIPADLPLILVDLRITHQTITLLTNSGLRHLVHLQNLYIESSGLRHTTTDALNGLTNLRHLNLRNNSLKLGIHGLPKEVFFNLPNLEWLSLAENPINLVPESYFKTTDGQHLRRLQLNSVKKVALRFEQNSLAGLGELQHLDISYSGVTEFPSTLETNLNAMTDLKEFYLGGNPWNCDCELRWLRTWIIRRHHLYDLQYIGTKVHPDGRTVQLEPICFTPSHMKGKRLVPKFNESPSFRCPPKSITQNLNLSIERGTSYVLSCEFYSDQSLGNSVAWYRNGQLIHNDTNIQSRLFVRSRERLNDHQYVSTPLDDGTVISHLNYTFLDPGQDSGVWTCQLHSSRGPFEFVGALFHISIVSASHPLSDASGHTIGLTVNQWNWIYAGIGVVLLFLLLAGVGVAIFYCCDPRTRSDHLFYRTLVKDRTGCASPPLGCRSCQKPTESMGHSTQPDDSRNELTSKVNSNVRLWKKGTKKKLHVVVNGVTEIDGRETNKLGVKTGAADGYLLTGQVVATGVGSVTVGMTLPTISFASVQPNACDSTALFVRPAVGGSEASPLFVSCDGPSPGILLAAANHPAKESPASAVYAIPSSLRHVQARIGCVKYQTMGYQATSLLPNSQPIPINTTSKISLPLNSFEDLQPSVATRVLPLQGYARQTAPCPVHGTIALDTMLKANKEADYLSSPTGLFPKSGLTPQPSGLLVGTNDLDEASVTTQRSSSSTSKTPRFTPPTRILPPESTQSLIMRDNRSGPVCQPCAQLPRGSRDLVKKSSLRQTNQTNSETGSSSLNRCARPHDLNRTKFCQSGDLRGRPAIKSHEHYISCKEKQYVYGNEDNEKFPVTNANVQEQEYDDYDEEILDNSSTSWNSSKPSISTDSNTPLEYGPPELDTSSPSHCSWHHPVSAMPYPVCTQTRGNRSFQFKAPPFVRAQSQVIPFGGTPPQPGAKRYFSTLPSILRKPPAGIFPNQFLYRSQTELSHDACLGMDSKSRRFQPSTTLIRPGSKHKLETDSEDDDDEADHMGNSH